MMQTVKSLDRQLTPDETFQLTLLCLCETAKNILTDRAKGNKRRLYWLEKLDRDIEAINLTYEGYLPENFINRSMKFNKWIETDMQSLLKNFQNGK